MAEVVLLHDPGRAQAAAVQPVLNAKLREHHFLEYLRQRVAAGIGPVRRALGDRPVMFIEEMAHGRVPADQHELAGRGALTERLQQPEEPLTVTSITVSPTPAGRQMHHVGDAVHRARDASAIVDAAPDDFDAFGLRDGAIMTERT